MKIDILGTPYEVTIKCESEDKGLVGCDGYCDAYLKLIVVSNFKDCDGTPEEKEDKTKETMRHEIIHGFLNESGLRWSSHILDSGWAKNEEMVDWFAIQFPKILKAYQDAKAI